MTGKQIVDMVLDHMTQKKSDAEIVAALIAEGVPESDTPKVIECVRTGFKAGTVAIVTDGMSAREIRFGENPVFDFAFKKGKAAMRFTTPGWVFLRMIWPYLVGIAVVIAGIVLWKMK